MLDFQPAIAGFSRPKCGTTHPRRRSQNRLGTTVAKLGFSWESNTSSGGDRTTGDRAGHSLIQGLSGLVLKCGVTRASAATRFSTTTVSAWPAGVSKGFARPVAGTWWPYCRRKMAIIQCGNVACGAAWPKCQELCRAQRLQPLRAGHESRQGTLVRLLRVQRNHSRPIEVAGIGKNRYGSKTPSTGCSMISNELGLPYGRKRAIRSIRR